MGRSPGPGVANAGTKAGERLSEPEQFFLAFPPTVQREMGYALFLAQMGERHSTMARTLSGFGGATVIEVRESHDGNAYRAVYL